MSRANQTDPPTNNSSMVEPPSPPAATVATNLEEQKTQLEIEKLKQEIQTSKDDQKWWRKSIRDVKLSEWLTATVASVTVAVVFFTGYFNASRERLAAQADRLQVEKVDLEGKRDRIAAEIRANELALAEAKSHLEPYQREDKALRKLTEMRKNGLHVKVTSDFLEEGVSFEFDSGDILRSGRGEWILKAGNPTRFGGMDDAMKAAGEFRKIRSISTIGYQMNDNEIAAIPSKTGIESILLRNCGITNQTISSLKISDTTLYLFLPNNQLTSVATIPASKAVVNISLRGNPITDDGIASIAEKYPKLKHIDLSRTKVTNDCMKHLVKIKNLVSVTVNSTSVSHIGLCKLESCPILNTIIMDKSQGTSELETFFKQKGRFMQVHTSMSWGFPPIDTTNDD